MGRELKSKGVLVASDTKLDYGPEDRAKAERKAKAAICGTVKFPYPEGDVRRGELVARRMAWSTDPGPPATWYLNVFDKIRFESDSVQYRLGYYRVFPGGRLRWGSQTSFCETREAFEALGVHFDDMTDFCDCDTPDAPDTGPHCLRCRTCGRPILVPDVGPKVSESLSE